MKNISYIFCLFLSTVTNAQGIVKGRNIITSSVSEYDFVVSSVASGAYSANSLASGFTNTAGSKTADYYGYLNLDPTNDNDWVLETTASRRDQSVNTWVQKGTTFLRVQPNGTAIYFFHNAESTNGTLKVGIVSPGTIDNGPTPDEFVGIELWKNIDLITLIPGYTKVESATDNFTFSVTGFEINVKYNGVDVPGFRITDYRIPMLSGKTGIKANSNSGVKFFNVTHAPNAFLYSDVANKIVDVRDFGWKTGTTTGTITGGTNQLTVTALNGLGVGDYIILPTGYENDFNGRAGGTRGTKGAGNTFPLLSYATTTAMNADHSKTDGLYAWDETTGNVYKYSTGTSTWSQPTTDIGYYYTGKAIPIALREQITAINGNVLTIAHNANVTATNAPVYFDNSFVLNKLGDDPTHDRFPYKQPVQSADYRVLSSITDTGWTVSIPTGTYALGEAITISNKPYFNIQGASKTGTILFSPNGAPSAFINRYGSGSGINEKYTLTGNAKDNGFGLKWWSWDEANAGTIPSQTYNFSSAYYHYGHIIQSSTNSIYRNIKIVDAFAGAVTTLYSDNVLIDSCDGVVTDGLHYYSGWYFQNSNSNNGIISNCNFTAPRAQGAFESFVSYNTIFRNCHSTNGYWSFNTADHPRIEIDANSNHNSATFTAGSISDWVSELQPILNVNNNLGNSSGGTGSGGYVEGFQMTIQGYQSVNNDMFAGVSIQPQIDGVTLLNCTYTAPNWSAPSAIPGPQAVRSQGTNVIIDGMIVTGTVNPSNGNGLYNSNIASQYGTVKNCVANKFAVGTTVTLLNNTGTVVTF